MRVPEGRVGQEQPLLVRDPTAELHGPEVPQQLPCAVRNRALVIHVRNRCGLPPRGTRVIPHRRVSVDDRLSEISQKPRRTIAPLGQVEQRGRMIDETRRASTRQKLLIRHQANQERDVRLHTPNAELLEAPFHAPGRVDKARPPGRHLYEQGVVVRVHDRAAERTACVEPNPHPRRRAVVRHTPVIGHEIVRGIFGGHAALHGVAVGPHGGLGG